MNVSEKKERDHALVVEFVKAEKTLSELAKEQGLTRERVRQIVTKALGHDKVRAVMHYRMIQKRMVKCHVCGEGFYKEVGAGNHRHVCGPKCMGTLMRELNTKWTRDKLIAWMQMAAKKLHRTPGLKDILHTPGAPHHLAYYREFGSLREGQAAAGLVPNPVGNPKGRPRKKVA